MEDDQVAPIFVVSSSSSSSSGDSDMLFFGSGESSTDSSTDDDEENEENADFLFPVLNVLLNGRPRVRVQNFIETALAKSDAEFREDFRVTREIYQHLLARLEESDFIPDHLDGMPKESASLSLLMTLWFLGNRNAHRDLSNLFNISFSSVSRILRRVLEWLVSIRGEWIVWPEGNKVQRVSDEFEAKADIAGCIGAIDGSHIPINKPEENGRDYYNRKQGYSMLLQGVVDCNLEFTNVYCGDPGSFHDVRLLRRSDLFYQAEVNTPAVFPQKTFLLGDKGYIGVGRKWIVTPFRDNNDLVQQQVDFNRRVSSTRVVVEQAFGILKARFRRLKYMELRDVNFMVHVIMGCCVLHNICIKYGDDGRDLANDDNAGDDNNANDDDNTDDDSDNEGNGGDEADPNAEVVTRQIELFTKMYPDAELPLRRGRGRV